MQVPFAISNSNQNVQQHFTDEPFPAAAAVWTTVVAAAAAVGSPQAPSHVAGGALHSHDPLDITVAPRVLDV